MFSYLSRVIAVLVLIAGLADFALGWAIALEWLGPYEEALARYTIDSSSGKMIARATTNIAFALALGTLAEISLAVRKRAKLDERE